jgi:predicted ATPase/predicted RNase H-like HicB family nuclease
MRISYFRIENFRNIRLAECDSPPDLMVICGANGCGKSSILHALMAAKEHAAPYGGFQMDPRCVSACAELASVTLRVEFSELERQWYRDKYSQECPEQDEIILQIHRGGRANVPKRSTVVRNLLSWYSREYKDSPGFFDYIDAHRVVARKELSTWNSSSLSDQHYKQSLGQVGTQKFNVIKEYLASLVMRDAQAILVARRSGGDCSTDSLRDIRDFFNAFFKPMQFVDVQIDSSPFKYIISTPNGEIDIDDLSSGEKEVLATYIHFHQLNPQDAVILFDEVDAHLHPDLERRYLEVFRRMSANNQILLTTHSPEIMVAAGSESLYTVSKVQEGNGSNQLARVTGNDEMHSALSSIMGSNGMVSINRKVVFIEGKESSADRHIYEALFPPSEHNISFMPAGDSSTKVKTSERVNALLSSSGTFQEFYSIIDGDIERPTDAKDSGRLFRLPVYHVENYLLDCDAILSVTRSLLLGKCPFADRSGVEDCLKRLLLCDAHLLPYTRARFDAEVAKQAKTAWDCVFKRDSQSLATLALPDFNSTRTASSAQLTAAAADGTWAAVAKGRNLLKAYCTELGVNYEHFRNLLIGQLRFPPKGLAETIHQPDPLTSCPASEASSLSRRSKMCYDVRSLKQFVFGDENMKQFKIVIEKHPDSYVAYPLGLKGVVIGQGDSYEAALEDVKSAIKFHMETFGLDETDSDPPVMEAFIAEARIAV